MTGGDRAVTGGRAYAHLHGFDAAGWTGCHAQRMSQVELVQIGCPKCGGPAIVELDIALTWPNQGPADPTVLRAECQRGCILLPADIVYP